MKNLDPIAAYEQEVQANIANLGQAEDFKRITREWFNASIALKYSYNFAWLGRPVIQYPQDIVAVQELIWKFRPDLIIETGIAHGGSLLLNASLLAMIDYCEAVEAKSILDPRSSKRKVVGIDIDIRAHNRAAIESHPMAQNVHMIEGSSIHPDVVSQVRELARNHRRTMVFLDSNHTHEHVLAELRAYSDFVSEDSYLVVFDTCVETTPIEFCFNRPWGPGNNPLTALKVFLSENPKFEIDQEIDKKLQITVAPNGFLHRKSGV